MTSRSRKQPDGSWEESETTWYRVSAWDTLAENVVESLRKGSDVVVVGRLFMDSYTDKTGQERQSLKVEAYNVAPSLKRSQWVRRDGGAPSKAPADNPWAVGGSDDIPPF